MRIAIYARVSTSHNGQDPETQLLPLREYAAQRGFDIYREYVDVISGIKESRPSLDDLLADAKKRKFDCVLVWKLDRLGRSLKHLIALIEEFESLGIQFISFTEGMDTTTPAGKLLFNVIGSIAAFERDLIRERVLSGLARARKQGKKLGRPVVGVRPERLLSLRSEGLSVRQIAQQLGCSHVTAYRRLRCDNS